MRTVIYLFFLTLIAGFAARGCRVHPAPLACAAAESSLERTICADPKLAAEDRLMTKLYTFARVSALGRGPSNELHVQREWLGDRDKCAAPPVGAADHPVESVRNCLAESYAKRNEQLALAVLFSQPDLALPELRRLDPQAAGLFEAVYLYARSPKLSDRDRSRVVALLEPYAAKTGDAGSWGEAAPANAAMSDDAFAEFVGIRSAYLLDDVPGRAFPCGALIRKPGLIDATGPHFGSSMDNLVIRSDCEDTLPPLPRFTSLVEKRGAGMTDCGGGTIRFAYYRAFSNDVDAARLATSAELHKKPVKSFPHRRKVMSADITAAVDDLAAYYVRYGRADKRQARPLARQMIYQMLDEAWQC